MKNLKHLLMLTFIMLMALVLFTGCKNKEKDKEPDAGGKEEIREWEFTADNLEKVDYMFSNCKSLISLSLGDKFDTSNVTDMSYMFSICERLVNLDLGNKFNTSKVTDMQNMFNKCSSLTILDLGDKFNTSNVTSMKYLFSDCSNLQKIYISESFARSNNLNSSNMFSLCNSLVGGNNTAYDSSHVGIAYAVIDTPETPGYFTYKDYNS